MAILKRIPSSSILEAIIAMVIIMLVFGISAMIYVNITSSGFSLQKVKADLLLKQLAIETEERKSYFDETISYEVLIIEKQVQKYEDVDDVLLLSLVAINQQQDTLAKCKQLLLVKKDE